MDYKVCYIIIALIALIYVSDNRDYIYEYMTLTNKISDIDKREYNVVSEFTDSDEAANKLSEVHAFMINFLRYMRKKFIINQSGSIDEKEFVMRVLKNYNPDTLFENNPAPGKDTSYVINKGDKFAICLRNKNPANTFHDIDILKFVSLHELSHMGTNTYGHNKEFWFWFQFMLIQAKESGLYIPINYSQNPINYCGLMVSNNPYFTPISAYM